MKVKRFYTNKNPVTQKQIISSGINELTAGKEPAFVCFGVPGAVDRQIGNFVKVPNYKEINGKPFTALLDEKYLGNAFVENDAALGAVGEAILGAGKDFQRVGYLTFGTGTGGALVVKKGHGEFGYESGEPGHTIIVPGGRVASSCNHAGCMEAYTSGHSFEALFNIKPQNCSDKGVWAKYAEYVNLGLSSIYMTWKCDIFIIGGSMALEYDLFSEFLKAPVPVVRSLTLDDAGVYGGFVLTKQILSSR
ncbi:MAG: N-acetyl-D-glucosamine kinase [candidate division WWE3 bacterium GW2011_GWA2_42_9]|nr:MAG: N-acetyl-D-glucosamine kinase [candidate division WWE3 bacterium GW2011_GWA2_42_9]